MRALCIPFALLLLTAACSGRSAPPAAAAADDAAAPTIAEAVAFYARQPRYLQPVPYTPVPAGLPDLRAETCGLCHQEIYAEWRVSTHARAWTDDAQFQAELEKSRTGRDVSWMCVNCHTPLVNQLPKLVAGLRNDRLDQPIYVDNPHFDAALQQDAITCATCHVRDGVVLGPYGDTKAPHPTRRDPDLLTSAVCTQCHQATAVFPELTLACVFDTGRELAEGPYGDEGYTCQHCHMPAVDRPLMTDGSPVRTTRRHWFGGSLIPKHPRFEAEVAPLRAVYPEGLTARWLHLPSAVVPGETVRLRFEGRNAAAGHMLPTGDPERYILLRASVVDADGATLAEREVRIGRVFEWHPTVRELSDNRLKPREARSWPLDFVVPANGELTLRFEASKWRISPENMAYHHLEGRYVASRRFIDETTVLPVRASPPAAKEGEQTE